MTSLESMDQWSVDQQVEFLAKGTVDLIERTDLRAKLERSAATNKPLTVKVGFDPTAPDIHLGHTVVIRKMKQHNLAVGTSLRQPRLAVGKPAEIVPSCPGGASRINTIVKQPVLERVGIYR